MVRYSIIHDKMPREFVLLQGTGCKWGRCSFCDYHTDVSDDPYEVNRVVLDQVTGQYGVLDIINSGSGFELDERTIAHIQRIVAEKNIHTLWFEMHWMYRNRLDKFRERILNLPLSQGECPKGEGVCNSLLPTPYSLLPEDAARCVPTIKFRCGIETFDPELRKKWNKGVPTNVTAEDVAKYFQGVCLLCCTEGETRERILSDIKLAEKHFEYFSVNVFCNNTTGVKCDPALVEWFVREVYPTIKDNPKIEVLIDNTDLGVG